MACTHVAMEQDRYKNWTPENLRSWMISKGFAVAGQGTKWEGITETLKHIGHSRVVRIYSDPMSEAWKELNKGSRIGVILFNSRKAPNGVRWTSCGHYVAFTAYKYENGKHLFYCKDSGGRNHDGWYSYERSMKGCIAKLWIVERIGEQVKAPVTAAALVAAVAYKPSTEYKGSLPKKSVKKGSKGSDVKAVQTFLNWCINARLKVDGSCGVKTVAAIKRYQKTYGLKVDGHFGPKSKSKAKVIIEKHKPVKPAPSTSKVLAKAKELSWAKGTAASKYAYPKGSPTAAFRKALDKVFPGHSKWGKGPNTGASCDVAAATCVRASGVEPNMPRGFDEQIKYKPKNMQKLVFTNVAPASVAKPGDMICYTKNASGTERHVVIMGEDGCLYEAQYQKTYLHRNASQSKVKTKRPKVWIFRAK